MTTKNLIFLFRVLENKLSPSFATTEINLTKRQWNYLRKIYKENGFL